MNKHDTSIYWSVYLIILVVLSTFFACEVFAVDWSTSLKPGDKVCLYDIGEGDPLIHNKSNDSLKYWYRAPVGNQKPVYRLRPMAIALQMRVLFPGLRAVEKDSLGFWYSGSVVVVNGGMAPGKNTIPVQMGQNILLRESGRTVIQDWQVLFFEKARFKINPKGPFGCRRKYNEF